MKIFKSKLFLFAVALVVLSIVFMLFAYAFGGPTAVSNIMGSILTPIEGAVAGIGDALSEFFGYFYRYSALLEENAALQSELAYYKNLETQYLDAVLENEQLRKLAGIVEKNSDFVCEIATVVSGATSGFASEFSINKGTLSGIEVGDSVITELGLVGYVSEAGLNYANVITIINMDSSVGAKISRTRQIAVAEGDFTLASDDRLKLAYLENDADVKVGDVIVTSGTGGIFPPGIIIGYVTHFEIESHGISSFAQIDPAVDFGSLTTVFVVKEFEVTE